jgi:hypothetical protein
MLLILNIVSVICDFLTNRKVMKPIMELIVALFVILVFDIVTLRWGFKSGDGWNNPEWVRRQNWKDFL